MAIKTIEIESDLWLKMVSHAEACLPEEGCGLAVGLNGKVNEIVPVENTLHSPNEFRMEAKAQIHAMINVAQKELDIIGIFHSHPRGAVTPSIRDVREHLYPESACIILEKLNGTWNSRAFLINKKKIKEIEILVHGCIERNCFGF